VHGQSISVPEESVLVDTPVISCVRNCPNIVYKCVMLNSSTFVDGLGGDMLRLIVLGLGKLLPFVDVCLAELDPSS